MLFMEIIKGPHFESQISRKKKPCVVKNAECWGVQDSDTVVVTAGIYIEDFGELLSLLFTYSQFYVA
jgi:hypothetical protein